MKQELNGAPMFLALAPMEGVTDAAVREVLCAHGGIDWCVTEFIRVTDHVLPPKVLLRECPELLASARTRRGTPVHLQLLGGNPETVSLSALQAAELGADTIDLNFGCPAPTVNRHDGGASLLRDPSRVEGMVAAVRARVPAHVSVSAKIRLGWDNPDDVVTLATCAEQGGASWITIHGRTRMQGYRPVADWERIGRAREAVRVPVVANGDIQSLETLQRCAEMTGCTRFMLGRGAIATPELFRRAAGLQSCAATIAWRAGLLLEYADVARSQSQSEQGTLCRMKQWARAMGTASSALAQLYEVLKRDQTLAQATERIASFCLVSENAIEERDRSVL